MKSLEKNSTFVVALGSGPEASALVESAVELAKQFSCSLELIHVVEPFNNHYMDTLYGLPGYNAQITAKIDEERIDVFKTLLARDAEKCPKEVSVNTKVLLGDVAEQILNHAKYTRASAIFMASKNSYRFFESSMSNTVAVMKNSPVPVIVFPKGTNFKEKSELNFMLCDDLTPNSSCAIDFVKATIRNNPEKTFKVNHVSVLEKDEDSADLIDSLLTPLTSEEKTEKPSQEDLEKALESSLTSRYSSSPSNSESSACDYKVTAISGNVVAELRSLSDSIKPDFLVFGSHEYVRLSPLESGKVPWSTMVTFKTPLIVAKP